jgi:hypothetical protein
MKNGESFTPTLWDAREGIEQVWFAGVHADIGGGYNETGLSDLTLAWMLTKVQPHGLLFGDRAFAPNGSPAVSGDPLMMPMHDSFKPPFVTACPAVRAIPPSAAIHLSVQQRCDKAQLPYRPRQPAARTAQVCGVKVQRKLKCVEVRTGWTNLPSPCCGRLGFRHHLAVGAGVGGGGLSAGLAGVERSLILLGHGFRGGLRLGLLL